MQMLTRRARLAGMEELAVWAGIPRPSGPDACASASEIARRGIARLAGIKDVLLRKGAFPVYGRMGRCRPNSVRGRRSIGQSKRRAITDKLEIFAVNQDRTAPLSKIN